MPVTKGIRVPLNGLISKLKTEGFEISTRTVLDIQKILAGFENIENPDTANLKLLLAPLICRNKEEQEKFYRLFDDYEALLKPEAQQLMESFAVKMEEDEKRIVAQKELERQAEAKRKRRKKIIKWSLISFGGALLLAFGYYLIFIRNNNDPTQEVNLKEIPLTLLYNGQSRIDIIKDSVVEISAQVSDTTSGKNYHVIITIGDSSYNQRTVRKRITKTDSVIVSASLMEGDSVIDKISHTNEVLCEPPPFLTIEKDSSLFKKQKLVIYRVINNQDSKLTNYKYQWTLTTANQSLQDTAVPGYEGASFKTKTPSLEGYTVTVQATGSANTQCDAKTYSTSIDEKPQLVLQVTGVKKLETRKDFNFMFLVVLLVGSGAFLGNLYSRYYERKLAGLRKKYFPVYETEKPSETVDALTGPYSIEFKPQDIKIPAEASINQLAEVLRKRHTGDVYRLNIDKTIRGTIKKAGFPVFAFTAQTQPTDFLFFVDKEYPDSHLVKLYNHLIETLKKEQVHLTAYSYNQYPLLLTNPALNHFFIPVEKLGGLYPETILFLFADTTSFFKPYNNQLHDWVTTKFKDWKTKIIFTSVAYKDWGEREAILYDAGFTVIPADTNASQVIEDEINNLIDKQKLKKTIPLTYSSKLINFNEWEEVKKYLNDVSKENKKKDDAESLYLLMKEWLASTAVYPYVNWEVTIAIGKAFEEKYNVPGKLLNYSNLLALSRIQWLKDGQMPEELRIQMLKDLDYKNEINAREALKVLLDDLKEEIKPGSVMYEEYRLQRVTNDFFIKKFHNGDIAPGDKDFVAMEEYLREGDLNWGMEVFYNSKDSGSSIRDKSGEKSIPLSEFIAQSKEEQRIIDEENNKEFKAKKRNLNTRFSVMSAAIVLLVLAVQLFGFKQKPFEAPRTVDRIIHFGNMINSNDQIAFVVNDKEYDTELSGDTALIVKDVPNDTSLIAKLIPETVGTAAISVPLGYSEYTASYVNPGDLTPLSIIYSDENEFKRIESELTDALSQYAVNTEKWDGVAEDTTTRVAFNEESYREDAKNIAAIASSILGRKIEAVQTDGQVNGIGMFLNFDTVAATPPDVCSPANLPVGLTEIWGGGSSRRLLNIDLDRNTIYYTRNDKRNYDTYRIGNICKNETTETFRIIVSSNGKYKVMFIKDVNRSSGFSFSLCEKSYSSIVEAESIWEDNCNNFNTFKLYYENDPGKVFLPAGMNVLYGQSQQKIKRIEDSIDIYKKQKLNPYLGGELFKNSSFDWDVPNNLPLQNIKTTSIANETPFDRSYVVYKINKDEKQPVEPVVDPPKRNPCDNIYTSMKDALGIEAKDVCRLNLKNQNFRSLPEGLSSFTALQYLDISNNYLTSKDSVALYNMFPKTIIIFSPQKIVEPPAEKWEFLIRLNTDSKKYYPDSDARSYFKRLFDEISKNTSGKIRLSFYGPISTAGPIEKSVLNYLQSNNWGSFIKSGRLITQISQTSDGVPSTRGEPSKISPATYYFDVFAIGLTLSNANLPFPGTKD